jgi:hypothetical protein
LIFTPRGVVGAVPIRRGLCHIEYIEALSSHIGENGEPFVAYITALVTNTIIAEGCPRLEREGKRC